MRTRRPGRPGAPETRRDQQPDRRRESRPKDARERRGPERELLYGRHAARESLRASRRRLFRLLVSSGSEPDRRLEEIRELARGLDVAIHAADRATLDQRVAGNHQGVVLEAGRYPYVADYDLQDLASTAATVLVLDGIEDPQNLGTLLRTADATGVRLVVIPSDRSAKVTPAVVNASAGAVEHLQVAEEVNLARWLDRAKAVGFWVVGMAGDEAAEPLFDTSMRPPVVLVVGSEGHGIRRLVRERCDILVSLPMVGRVESLNAAVAGSIGLYEIVRDSLDD